MSSTHTTQPCSKVVVEDAQKNDSVPASPETADMDLSESVKCLSSIHDSLCTLTEKLNLLNGLVKKHFMENGGLN